MVFVQIGGGVSNAGIVYYMPSVYVPIAPIVVVYTLAGGFAGVLVYGLVEPFIRSAIRPAQPAKHHWYANEHNCIDSMYEPFTGWTITWG